jgi:hypothetical protein
MAKMSFTYSDRELRANIDVLDERVDRALKGTALYHATEGTTYMKEHAPWTDRTTNARNGLHADTNFETKGRYEVIFAHTVHYGIYLELANSGRYEIIMPTVRHEGTLLMDRLRGLLPKLQGAQR